MNDDRIESIIDEAELTDSMVDMIPAEFRRQVEWVFSQPTQTSQGIVEWRYPRGGHKAVSLSVVRTLALADRWPHRLDVAAYNLDLAVQDLAITSQQQKDEVIRLAINKALGTEDWQMSGLKGRLTMRLSPGKTEVYYLDGVQILLLYPAETINDQAGSQTKITISRKYRMAPGVESEISSDITIDDAPSKV